MRQILPPPKMSAVGTVTPPQQKQTTDTPDEKPAPETSEE